VVYKSGRERKEEKESGQVCGVVMRCRKERDREIKVSDSAFIPSKIAIAPLPLIMALELLPR
jgi:hypothetical protein